MSISSFNNKIILDNILFLLDDEERNKLQQANLTPTELFDNLLAEKQNYITEFFHLQFCNNSIIKYLCNIFDRDDLNKCQITVNENVNDMMNKNVEILFFKMKITIRQRSIEILNITENKEYNHIIHWYENGKISAEMRYCDKKYHNENGPAIKTWDDNGILSGIYFYIDGKLHNENGPAFISYSKIGVKECEQYYYCNKHHRIDGPASIEWDKNGNEIVEYWYNNERVNGGMNELYEYINYHGDGEE